MLYNVDAQLFCSLRSLLLDFVKCYVGVVAVVVLLVLLYDVCICLYFAYNTAIAVAVTAIMHYYHMKGDFFINSRSNSNSNRH